MARNNKPSPIGIAWDPDPEADDYQIFMDPGEDENFLELVDAGVWPVHATSDRPEYLFQEGDPADADFAVVSHAIIDNVEHWSDPHAPSVWQAVAEGDTPLAGPSGGRVLTST